VSVRESENRYGRRRERVSLSERIVLSTFIR